MPSRAKHFYCSPACRYKGYNRRVQIRVDKSNKLKARIAELEQEVERLKNPENNP
jgi:cell division protein FtsB